MDGNSRFAMDSLHRAWYGFADEEALAAKVEAADTGFWLAASEASLKEIWGSAGDDIHDEILEK